MHYTYYVICIIYYLICNIYYYVLCIMHRVLKTMFRLFNLLPTNPAHDFVTLKTMSKRHAALG